MQVDETGFSPAPYTVWDDNNDGIYRITFVSVLAATYQISIFTSGTPVEGGPWPLTINADVLSSASTADYPTYARAGLRTSFLCYTRDKWGNLIQFDDYTSSFTLHYWNGDVRCASAVPAFFFTQLHRARRPLLYTRLTRLPDSRVLHQEKQDATCEPFAVCEV